MICQKAKVGSRKADLHKQLPGSTSASCKKLVQYITFLPETHDLIACITLALQALILGTMVCVTALASLGA